MEVVVVTFICKLYLQLQYCLWGTITKNTTNPTEFYRPVLSKFNPLSASSIGYTGDSHVFQLISWEAPVWVWVFVCCPVF